MKIKRSRELSQCSMLQNQVQVKGKTLYIGSTKSKGSLIQLELGKFKLIAGQREKRVSIEFAVRQSPGERMFFKGKRGTQILTNGVAPLLKPSINH